jgi:hypothetical protein
MRSCRVLSYKRRQDAQVWLHDQTLLLLFTCHRFPKRSLPLDDAYIHLRAFPAPHPP